MLLLPGPSLCLDFSKGFFIVFRITFLKRIPMGCSSLDKSGKSLHEEAISPVNNLTISIDTTLTFMGFVFQRVTQNCSGSTSRTAKQISNSPLTSVGRSCCRYDLNYKT